jgi:hypothetical protein
MAIPVRVGTAMIAGVVMTGVVIAEVLLMTGVIAVVLAPKWGIKGNFGRICM